MLVTPKKWIHEPDENGNGLLLIQPSDTYTEWPGCPLPIETHHVDLSDVTLDKDQEFTIIFEAMPAIKAYANDEDYYEKSHTNFASESVIPCGYFPASNDPDFQESGTAIISGHIVKTYDDPVRCGFDADDQLISINCLGIELDIVIHGELNFSHQFALGEVIRGTFWVQGWPEGID